MQQSHTLLVLVLVIIVIFKICILVYFSACAFSYICTRNWDTTIPHQKLKSRLATIIRNSFLQKMEIGDTNIWF